jgi:hypothetical protein
MDFLDTAVATVDIKLAAYVYAFFPCVNHIAFGIPYSLRSSPVAVEEVIRHCSYDTIHFVTHEVRMAHQHLVGSATKFDS